MLTKNNIKKGISESEFEIESFSPIKNKRVSFDELERIKKYSDENLYLISAKLDSENEEEKRNIIVNLIGALDYYIHEIVIWGLIQITMNGFPEGKDYNNIKISIKYLKEAIGEIESFKDLELKKTIIEDIRRETYQKWKKIRDGLRIVLPKKIDDKIGNLTNLIF